MMTMALQLFQQPRSTSLHPTSNTTTSNSTPLQTFYVPNYEQSLSSSLFVSLPHYWRRRSRRTAGGLVFVGQEETRLRIPPLEADQEEEQEVEDDDPSPQDLEYLSQVKRVLELLRKNRDMLFNEVKLTVMIEDPREVERRQLLGIDDSEAPTRDDLAAALEEVNEGKIPKNRIALRMLAEEMIQWPNLEVEAPKKKRGKSLYAKATDTGVDPEVAATRLNIDWDTAANIEEVDVLDDTEVPSAVGYGALYLVTAFPVIIGISVVLILFYNSLQ